MTLRLVSLMADNSAFFYRRLAGYLTQRTGIGVELEDCVPWPAREQMLDRGEAHVGIICGLPYVRKVDQDGAALELLAAPVPCGARYGGRPVYYSDVVVHRDSPWRAFADLCGTAWAYNEPGSHSGYNLTRWHLARLGEGAGFFGRAVEAGAHQVALRWVIEGRVDASAIDSTVLELELAQHPHLAESIRIIDTLGPSPIPPAVISTRVPLARRLALRETLLAMHAEPEGAALLAAARFARFTPVTDADYNPIRRMAREAEAIPLALASPHLPSDPPADFFPLPAAAARITQEPRLTAP